MTEYRYEDPVEVRHNYVEVDVYPKVEPMSNPGVEPEEDELPPEPEDPPPSPTRRPQEVRFSTEVTPDPAGHSPSRNPPVKAFAVNARTERQYYESKNILYIIYKLQPIKKLNTIIIVSN